MSRYWKTVTSSRRRRAGEPTLRQRERLRNDDWTRVVERIDNTDRITSTNKSKEDTEQ